MPRVRPLKKTDPREIAVREEIGAIRGRTKMSQGELARKAGINPTTLSKRLSEGGIGSMRLSEYWAIQDVAAKYG